MKKIIIVGVLLFFTYGIICSGQTANVISFDADKPVSAIQSTMWGIFFEDINFAADGGINAKHFKVFADSMKRAAVQTGKTIYVGAAMQESQTQSWQTITTQTWNTTMIPEANDVPDFYIGHNYITPYGENSNASTDFEGNKAYCA
jgi:hypothetical protein